MSTPPVYRPRPASYTGPRPRTRAHRMADDTNDPIEAEWLDPADIDEPDWVER